MDKKFCENLRSVRKYCNYTQRQVAEKLDVVESCYANWEQGRTEPNIDMIRKLSDILNIDLDDLFNSDL